MQDTFQWTDDLAFEFASRYPLLTVANKKAIIEAFKANNSPKKEWEIVAYRFTPLNGIGGKDVIVRPGSPKWPNEPDKDYEIFSVRRLSDGEVFNVGDRIKTETYPNCVIESFSINNNTLAIQHTKNTLFVTRGNVDYFNKISKLPQKVFTTIDGADIYEDGNFWHVNEDWTLSNFGVSTEFIDYSKPDKDFSTRQAAEEYILNNRLLLSLSDVKYVLDSIQFAHDNTGPFILEVLTNAVKQKLNQ